MPYAAVIEWLNERAVAIVALMQIAMMGNLHYTKLRDRIFSHPTLSESLNPLLTEIDRA